MRVQRALETGATWAVRLLAAPLGLWLGWLGVRASLSLLREEGLNPLFLAPGALGVSFGSLLIRAGFTSLPLSQNQPLHKACRVVAGTLGVVSYLALAAVGLSVVILAAMVAGDRIGGWAGGLAAGVICVVGMGGIVLGTLVAADRVQERRMRRGGNGRLSPGADRRERRGQGRRKKAQAGGPDR